MIDVGDHYRPIDHASEPCVYRVVGATDEVTLLRVTDGNGRRVNTGEIRRIAPSALDAEFERAENPDAGFTPVASVRNALSGLYWSVRKYL
ncbi:hypothetical protein [Haladaptatus salinisoli]|uniref:hypothetical protein n=1 Tax=Haladaptatus salinisoli TaxID=2884876 RepID=UPI001D0B90C6|nr:hypothetical protein [Haladaptatus salinisoli]